MANWWFLGVAEDQHVSGRKKCQAGLHAFLKGHFGRPFNTSCLTLLPHGGNVVPDCFKRREGVVPSQDLVMKRRGEVPIEVLDLPLVVFLFIFDGDGFGKELLWARRPERGALDVYTYIIGT